MAYPNFSKRWLALALSCGACAVTSKLNAQPKLATDIKASEIQAVVEAPTGGTDRQIKVVDAGTHNVAVGVLRRGKTTPGAPVGAINHEQVTEVYYVVSGSGTLLTGGTVDNARPAPGDGEIVKIAVGPSNNAVFREPAQRRMLQAGDMVIIPAGVYHGFTDVTDHIEYVSVRSDPNHVLPAGYISPVIKPAGRTSAAGSMVNPYQMLENWPHLGDIKPGAAIGIVPDGRGGTWLHHRSEPPIIHFDAAGNILKSFGNGMFVQAHGFCEDRDGNFWAGDSGPFNDTPGTAGRGYQLFKFDANGKLLQTLGKAGVSKAGRDTFLGPTACAIAPNGDLIVADGHWPRPSTAQQNGDRLVRLSKTGEFIAEYGHMGTGPGEFMGPHGLAFDSRGRLFVADRSNNRIQIFDQDMRFVDEWRHFGRPSGIAILKDDALIVADSESSQRIAGPPEAPEGGGSAVRNPGWKNGIRIGSATDGSLKYFVPDTRPEGLAADELGNIFAGLTAGCQTSRSGGCLQKFVLTQR